MIFNSATYLLFLIIVIMLYWILPRRPRLWMLFIGSLTFYGFWRIEFIPVMMISVITNYLVSIAIDRTTSQKNRRLLLWISLTISLGLLAYFKYFFFFADNLSQGMRFFGLDLKIRAFDIILPLGVSFYTFQAISYTVDVYRRFIRPERDFILFSCYVIFFPQLIAGPILRAKEVIWQLDRRPRFDMTDVGIGLRRIFIGLFLKVVLADNIAPLVNSGFFQPVDMLSALDIWTLSFLFGFQIYFDFSAYSHIAIGSARLMGIHFPENFNFPYLANSPREFWRRWHISLSSWIRDYLYLPLCGRKVLDQSTGGLATATDTISSERKNSALFLTWAIMGLWHGANWTFVIWGLWHALLIFVYRKINIISKRMPYIIKQVGGWALTLPLVMIGWIPFRAENLTDTLGMWLLLFKPSAYLWLGLRANTYLIAAAVMVSVILAYIVKSYILPLMEKKPVILIVSESLAFGLIVALDFIFLRPISQFIYFQF